MIKVHGKRAGMVDFIGDLEKSCGSPPVSVHSFVRAGRRRRIRRHVSILAGVGNRRRYLGREAREMAADAIRGYIESLVKDGLPIPPADPFPLGNIIKETVAVAVERE